MGMIDSLRPGVVWVLVGFSFLLFSCKEEPVQNYPFLTDGTEIPDNLDSVRINYENFFAIKYGLTYPFIKSANEFYFFETYRLLLFKYNLIDSTWQSNFSYNTDEYISTDKYIFTEGDSVVIASYFESSRSLDIYSAHPGPLSLKLLKKNLPLGEQLYTSLQSTSLWDRNRLIILLHSSSKIITADMNDYSIKTVPDSHLSGISHDESNNSSAVIGKFGRDIYLYYYSYKKLFRFNLDTFNFTEIPVPKYLSTRLYGVPESIAMVGNYFCFWPNNLNQTLCYNVVTDKWLSGGANPFYRRSYWPLNCTSDVNGVYYKEGESIKRISIK